MADDTLVIICAIMKPGEGRYMLDALRWANVVSQKGINPQNIHLFVNEHRILELVPLLTPLWRDFPDARFPITLDNYQSLFATFHRGDHSQFLPCLLDLVNATTIRRVAIVLINHGSSSRRFGNAALESGDIVQKLNCITKPTIVVCSDCHSDKILTSLEPRQEHNCASGSLMCFIIKENQEIFMNVIQYTKQTNLELLGNVDLLLHPFFGPNPPTQNLSQFSVLDIQTGSQISSLETKRPQFKDELTDLVDNFLTITNFSHSQKADFWDSVYNSKFAQFAAGKPGGAKKSINVGKVIEDKRLTDEYLNGAGLPDVLVTYNLADPFLDYLQSLK